MSVAAQSTSAPWLVLPVSVVEDRNLMRPFVPAEVLEAVAAAELPFELVRSADDELERAFELVHVKMCKRH